MDNNELMNLLNLHETKARFDVLINALAHAASLNYSGNGLTFNSDIIDAAFAAVAPFNRNDVYDALKLQAAEKGGEKQ